MEICQLHRVALACKLDEQQEYLRRNRILGLCEGIKANLTLVNSNVPKRTPKWLLFFIRDALFKLDDIVLELRVHRDEEKHQTARH